MSRIIAITIRRSLLSLFLLIGSFEAAFAQSATATLTGTVTDETGAVVAGATVTVTDSAKQLERQVTTNSDGFFILPQLLPSHYKIKVQRTGFATAELPDVLLNVGDQSSIRIQLKVAQVSGEVGAKLAEGFGEERVSGVGTAFRGGRVGLEVDAEEGGIVGYDVEGEHAAHGKIRASKKELLT